MKTSKERKEEILILKWKNIPQQKYRKQYKTLKSYTIRLKKRILELS